MRNSSSDCVRGAWIVLAATMILLATGGCGVGTAAPTVIGPTVTIAASPTQVAGGQSSTLTVTASGATTVAITDTTDSKSYPLAASGGTLAVTPTATTTYTVTATGSGGSNTATVTVTVTGPGITITANPMQVQAGGTTTLTVTAAAATSVVITDNTDTNSYTLASTGGTQVVTPNGTTTYTATAKGASGTTTASVTVVAAGSVTSVNHVLFMMQENRTFDTYFGMLNPYRKSHKDANGNAFNMADDGNIYNVDGIDDKLSTSNSTDENNPPPYSIPVQSFSLFHTTSSCLDDMTSSWLESYGDVSRYDFLPTRGILMDGFVHTAENYAQSAGTSTTAGEGSFTDFAGKRAMAYYEDTSVSGASELNYYYYMASEFALSDRWFSPVATKTVPNRIATLTGGTTQGLVFDPFADDKLTSTLTIPTIFEELDNANPPVSWKIYYTLTEGGCKETDGDCGSQTGLSLYPVTTFSDFGYSGKYLYAPPAGACVRPTQGSKQAVDDPSDSFCIDPDHIAPMSQLFTDMANNTLPSFSYIEPGYGVNDEHPGSGQSIYSGQVWVATILGKLMASPSWFDAASGTGSVFFLSYDEGGGPYEHVPPVPGDSNKNTIIANMGYLPGDSMYPVGGSVYPAGSTSYPVNTIPDISVIAVNPDNAPGAAALYWPCADNGPDNTSGNPTPTLHCDLNPSDPGASSSGDAPAVQGFAAQLGFRLPNIVISPFTRRHYVSHNPVDHTAVLKFVENRFIGPSAHLTYRDAAQSNFLDFFDFTGAPWAIPPTGIPAATPVGSNSTCTPTCFASGTCPTP